VDKTKLAAIRNQINYVWTQFQPAPSSEQQPVETKAALEGQPPIDEADKFTDNTAPLSKLNIPKVDIDPWSAFWLVLAAIVGGTGVFSYLLLVSVPPLANCQSITPLSTDGERLYCAQVGAKDANLKGLVAAMDVVRGWDQGHPLYTDAQNFLNIWSRDLTRLARKQLNEGELEQAIATLKKIPANSPTYDKTQELIGKWSEQSDKGSTIATKFEAALKNAQWDSAFVQLQSVRMMRGRYWNTFQHDRMALRMSQERDGWDRLQAAKDALEGKAANGYLVGANQKELNKELEGTSTIDVSDEEELPKTPERLLAAIEIANQIDAKTYVYAQGQKLRSVWSKQILQMSVAKHQEKDFSQALAIASKVPKDVPSYSEAQDWVKLNQSEASAGQRHILALMDSIAQVKRIPKGSPIYGLAQAKAANWKGLLKQQTQLQWAKSVATVRQPSSLALAIATAKQVPSNIPEGEEAQSQIAVWQQQVQEIEHRTTIARAQQIMAGGESLANLRAAVGIIDSVSKNGKIGTGETAEMVADWRKKLQTIEDTPLLTNAQTLANQGKLEEAVKMASRVTPGRALYANAQANIRYWSLELMEIADRRVLQRAIAVYRSGNISQAIDIGSAITRRSPMYSEARGYIDNWQNLIAPRIIQSLDRR
jgi:soluble cytochrome b562